jgi:hypothetical protein
MGIFHKIDPDTFSIKFKGHNRPNFLADFRSIVTPTSIRNNRVNPDNSENPFHVRMDVLKKKWGAIAKRRGLSWEA